MKCTLSQVSHENPLVTAASFAFGRDDTSHFPHTFKKLISQPLLANDKRLKKFEMYLDRHIENHGEGHSQLAKKMCAVLCKTDADWALAKEASVTAVKARLQYFDLVADKIEATKIQNRLSVVSAA